MTGYIIKQLLGYDEFTSFVLIAPLFSPDGIRHLALSFYTLQFHSEAVYKWLRLFKLLLCL